MRYKEKRKGKICAKAAAFCYKFMIKILLIGNGAREHAIAERLKASPTKIELAVFASANNPGLMELSSDYQVGDILNNQAVIDFAKSRQIDFAVIGPEAPLANGLVDELEQAGIKSVGPYRALAKIETSKSFARELFKEYQIEVNPEFMIFESMEGVEEWLDHLNGQLVIKPDGLTGGKGVKVIGDHFQTMNEGLAIIQELIDQGQKVIIEEKLIGQEFSLMSLSDGEHLIHLPLVQDNKRAWAGDLGPNTGGMGSYSCVDFNLPFLKPEDICQARKINEQVAQALKNKTGQPYRGFLYGNFMAVKKGVKIIEYNARLGDPEAMNVMAVFKTDFVEACQGIINGNLNKVKVEFEELATVCKYLVPEGYPLNPVKDVSINVSAIDQSKVSLYYAAVDQKKDGLYLTGSRAVALIGKHRDLYLAEKLVEEQMQNVIGPVVHRQDIGTKELIEKRIKMMAEVRL